MCRRHRVRGRDQPFLVALAEHFQPPALVTVRVAARKKNRSIVLALTSGIRNPPGYTRVNSQRARK
jgi:hypothetical protein